MKHYDNKTKRTLAVYIFVFFLMVLGFIISGYVSYRNFEQGFRHQAENQISSIADLKVSELVNWRRERLGDAQAFYRNPVFSGLVERYFENPADIKTKNQIISRLEFYQSFAQYDMVCLLDVKGIHRLVIPATPEESEQADARLMLQASASLDSGQVIFLDFQRDTNQEGEIYLSILVPIFAEQSEGRPLGVLVLHINPDTYLYPYINHWPIPSDTAETLLVRRDGQDVLFLSQLRFEQNAELNLRFPLSRTDLPAVKAALGQSGLVEGMDYRGEPVLADVRPVPGSPWHLVSKMDIAEVYAPLRTRLWQTLLLIGMAIFVAGAGLLTVWRQQRVLFYRAQAEAAGVLRESEEKFRKAFILSPDSININRLEDGMYVSINNGFTKITGYTPDEAIGKTSLELDIWVDPQDRQRLVTGLKKTGEVENLEARFRAKNGDIMYGLMSASMLELKGIPHIISITHDITERKQAEETLRESGQMLHTVLENFPGVVFWKDAQSNYLGCNYSFAVGAGLNSPIEVIGKTDFDMPWKTTEAANYRADDREVMEKGKTKLHIIEIQHQIDNHVIWFDTSKIPLRNSKGQVIGVLGVSTDITERKRAEEAQRESEERLRLAVLAGHMGTWDRNFLSGQLNWSVECKTMFGLAPEVEMTDERFMQAVHPEDRVPTDLAIREALEKQTDFDMEYRVIWSDGTFHWIAAQGRGYYNEAVRQFV
jgi:PAS domain S-box-containing protein